MKQSLPFGLAISLLLLSMLSSANIDGSSPDKFTQRHAESRAIYQEAFKAFTKDSKTDLSTYLAKLEGYPLTPYLAYRVLLTEFKQKPDVAITKFLKENEGTLLAQRLRMHWLNHLGKNKDWSRFTSFDDGKLDTVKFSCYRLAAKQSMAGETAKTESWEAFKKIWLTGAFIPSACSSLRKSFEADKRTTQALYAKRFDLAYRNGNNSLAEILAKKLTKSQIEFSKKVLHAQQHVDYWVDILTAAPKQKFPIKLSSASVKRLLKKVAGKDHKRFAQILETKDLPLYGGHLRELKILSAWYFAKFNASEALDWIEQQPEAGTIGMQKKKLRYQLQAQAWPDFQKHYETVDESLKSQSEWRYWYAQSLIRQGDKSEPNKAANEILNRLSNRRGFYGLLAATELDRAHAFNSKFDLSNMTVKKQTLADFDRAIEHYLLGNNIMARREWREATKNQSTKQWQQASVLAYQLGWHEQIIRAAARSGFGGTIKEQYPLAYLDIFQKQAVKNNLDLGWLLAMSRQESGFSPAIRSNKGAVGVMQLMPATAKQLCKELGVKYDKARLTDPTYNIFLGSNYVRQLLEQYDNDYVLATAAYNAGPHRVDEWLSLRKKQEDKHWIATIPYKETRKYVQKIMAFSHYYQQRFPEVLKADSTLALNDFSQL
jgi:soluble lytic murein transglycosylase